MLPLSKRANLKAEVGRQSQLPQPSAIHHQRPGCWEAEHTYPSAGGSELERHAESGIRLQSDPTILEKLNGNLNEIQQAVILPR